MEANDEGRLYRRGKSSFSNGPVLAFRRSGSAGEIPLAKWVWVDAGVSIIEERVRKRDIMVTAEYARKNNEHFEEPDFICYKIINQSEAEILTQARMIEKKWTQEV